ncbi:hypothetical protein BWI93_10130 [Siphonobacter sp. BAB-5385]|uniref:hypothetical protein n=1 Tax=Siphonobacter sp. BAB-5385 TaxID=1864822 RepID=UPI000B9E433A|nr:hypothetical protein [Siphonobacter sp. BAB-5385]OZI08215.1 hypothetical protein BWI93_10130 [Siphonobacter sp. BAB-5385]
MHVPEWIEVRESIKLKSENMGEFLVPEGFYFRLDGDRYYLTNGDGADFEQGYIYLYEVLVLGLNTGHLFDCSSGTYQAFKKALAKVREAQKMYFSRRSKPLLDLAKAEEKRMDDLLAIVMHSHPDELIVGEALKMRMFQKEYFKTGSSYAKSKAIALEKAIDKLLSEESSPKTETIQTSIFK